MVKCNRFSAKRKDSGKRYACDRLAATGHKPQPQNCHAWRGIHTSVYISKVVNSYFLPCRTPAGAAAAPAQRAAWSAPHALAGEHLEEPGRLEGELITRR